MRRESHAYADSNGDSNGNAYTDSYANCDSNRYAHTDSYANCYSNGDCDRTAAAFTDAAASADTAAAPLVGFRNSFVGEADSFPYS